MPYKDWDRIGSMMRLLIARLEVGVEVVVYIM